MSEREKFPRRIEANTGGQWFMLNEDEGPQRDDAEYIRADLAAEREQRLVEALRWVLKDGLRYQLSESDMCVEEARAILSTHEQTDDEGLRHE